MNNTTANKTYMLPAILSFFIPSSGQLLKRHWYRAATFWGVVILGSILLAFVSLPFIFAQVLLLLAWVWNVYDAFTARQDYK